MCPSSDILTTLQDEFRARFTRGKSRTTQPDGMTTHNSIGKVQQKRDAVTLIKREERVAYKVRKTAERPKGCEACPGRQQRGRRFPS
jgi:hypothetical protein